MAVRIEKLSNKFFLRDRGAPLLPRGRGSLPPPPPPPPLNGTGSERCVDTDSDCGSESILLATDNDTNVKSKPTNTSKEQKTGRWCGSAKYSTKYKKSWEKKYDFVKPSSHSDSHYLCTVCQKNVSIKHQGALDIQRHSERKIHKQKILFAKSQSKLSLNLHQTPYIHDQVTAAEIRNTVMIAHHNAALCLADHIGPMLRASITDSQIVKGYHCARSKTACILNYALAPYLIDELVSSMKQMPYSLSVDGSNDTGLSKMNPLTVRIYDVNEKSSLAKVP